MTYKTPLFWAVLGGVIYMHYTNGENAKKAEEDFEHEKELTRLALERRRAAPLSPSERLEAVTLKKHQLGIWKAKLVAAEKSAKVDASAPVVARVDHAKARISQLHTKIVELEAGQESGPSEGDRVG